MAEHSIKVGDEVSWDGASPGKHVVTQIQQRNPPGFTCLKRVDATSIRMYGKRVVINSVEYEGMFGEDRRDVTIVNSEGNTLTCALERIW